MMESSCTTNPETVVASHQLKWSGRRKRRSGRRKRRTRERKKSRVTDD
jgi:hypothetical protein